MHRVQHGASDLRKALSDKTNTERETQTYTMSPVRSEFTILVLEDEEICALDSSNTVVGPRKHGFEDNILKYEGRGNWRNLNNGNIHNTQAYSPNILLGTKLREIRCYRNTRTW
jgi:hypothetical protein